MLADLSAKVHSDFMAISSENTYIYPYCGVPYAVHGTHSPICDSGSANCTVRSPKMNQWSSTNQTSHTQIGRDRPI
jgi:hypothetical protein